MKRRRSDDCGEPEVTKYRHRDFGSYEESMPRIDVGVIVLPKACCVNWAGGPRVTGDRGLLAGNVYTLGIRVITSPLRAIKQPSLSLCTSR
ncbi:box A-binding factor-like isoform X2, partial [Vespula squamosa]